MNEIQIIRSQLAAEQSHAAEIVNACTAVFGSTGSATAPADTTALFLEACVSYLVRVLARFEEAEAPIAPVYDVAQIMRDRHYRERGSVVEVDDPDLGSVWMANIVPRLSRTPGAIRRTGTTVVGGDRNEILHGLGEAPVEAVTTQQEEPDARS